MKVINLYGGPGTGKSTTAAGLFFEMKNRGILCELVTEYAKDMHWEGRDNVLRDQLYVTAKQHRKLLRLKGQVDYAITDSPLLLGVVYDSIQEKPLGYKYTHLVEQLYGDFDNKNFMLQRVKPYVETGRSQTEAEAKDLDLLIADVLLGDTYAIVTANQDAPKEIMKVLRLA